MSDADNQMGGTGGETGPPPGKENVPGQEAPGRGGPSGEDRDDKVTEESKDSFPASDPPGHY